VIFLKTKERKHTEDPGAVWMTSMFHILKGSVLAGVVTIVLILVCTFAISAGWLQQTAAQGAIMASCVVGTFIGGMFATRSRLIQPILSGIGVGIVLFLLLMTAGVLAYGTVYFSGGIGSLAAYCCGGALAGVLCRKPKKKHKR